MALFLAACVLLGACSGFTAKISRRFGGDVPFTVELDSLLNHDFPLAVDFVVVYDKGLYEELGKLTAANWFEKREQYRSDNDPEKLEVHSWQWVPPSDCPPCDGPGPQVVKHRLGAQGGVLFANYFNAGDHRHLIEPLKSFALVLGETEARIEVPANPRAAKKAARQREKEAKRKEKRAKKEKEQARQAKKKKKKKEAESDS
ncbi:MAG: hypothetical protein ACE5GX_02555 [Thermoanaerobaculia bacterium]